MSGQNKNATFVFFGFLVAVLVVFSLLNEHFMTSTNMIKAFQHLSLTALAALGLTFVIAVGHSDMSFHFASCFAAMTMSWMIAAGYGVGISILGGLIGGGIFGLANGLLVGRFRLPDMVVTIGIGSVAYGLAYIYSDGRFIYRNFLKSGIMQLNQGKFLGLPYPIYILAASYFLCWLLLHRTSIGRRMYAVGGNRTAAEFSGTRAYLYVLLAFIICAGFASLANIIMASSQGKCDIRSGLAFLMPAWAGVYVGISVFGKVTVYGTLLGTFLISIMQNGFTLMSVSFYYMDFVIAATLMISIAVANRRYFTLAMSRN